METFTTTPAAEHPSDPVLKLVGEAFDLLAELHAEVHRRDVAQEADDHISAATREIAAIQRMYERRGER